jgi:hypothetical protein
MAFQNNVLVNCPFDEEFYDLLRPLLFTIVYVGLTPRIALEVMDSGKVRIDRIVELIRESQYAVHDLSRIAAAAVGDLYRLNMPFELGIDLGARYFGAGDLTQKRCLVLEAEPYRYKAALSDLSGSDIAHHGNEPARVVVAIRSWLKNACKVDAPGPTLIWDSFNYFMADLHVDLLERGFSKDDIDALPIPELIENMVGWVAANKIRRRR